MIGSNSSNSNSNQLNRNPAFRSRIGSSSNSDDSSESIELNGGVNPWFRFPDFDNRNAQNPIVIRQNHFGNPFSREN